MNIGAGEKNNRLVDKETELLNEIKVEIDIAEEELVHDGEYVVLLHYLVVIGILLRSTGTIE